MKNSNRVIVAMSHAFNPDLEAALDERFDLRRLWSDGGENAGEIRALVVNPEFQVSGEALDRFPALEIVGTFSVGLDRIDVDACRKRGVSVAYTPDVVTDETADTALGLILATMRRLCAADRYVREGLWPVRGHFPPSHKVTGKRVGIVGLGRIGGAIARRLQGFSCSISYFSRSEKPVPYTRYGNLVELARDVDVLVVACGLSRETHHLVNREVLEALGPEGTLINIARGPIVDEAELVRALVEKRVGAAGLDVFEREPKVPEELLVMENVVLLPHVGTATVETRRSMGELVVANLEAHFSGKPLLTPV